MTARVTSAQTRQPAPLAVRSGTKLDSTDQRELAEERGPSVVELQSFRHVDSLDVLSGVFRANGSLSETDPSVVQRIDDVREFTATGIRPFGHQLDGDHLGTVDKIQFEWIPQALRLAIPAVSR